MEIDGHMLLNVWTELDYRWDVCRVTKGHTLNICSMYQKLGLDLDFQKIYECPMRRAVRPRLTAQRLDHLVTGNVFDCREPISRGLPASTIDGKILQNTGVQRGYLYGENRRSQAQMADRQSTCSAMMKNAEKRTEEDNGEHT
ncbi:hypothetical protein AVEN_194188-1 [Araneus ventricosus]|uniref:Uncharacterized protein n=1 Tax=Araneus ventricosus TaxID=182803 RepID=A0A4Y2EPX0_ARAVE|nr:hypothetical protein AVEN_194188-1 [Araneus ventricosus]